MLEKWLKARRLPRAAEARTALAQRVASQHLRKALTAPLPDATTPFRELALLAIDLEMTGLDPVHDRVLSVGWVPIDAARVRLAGADHRLIRSPREVGASATIHGIVDADRETGESAESVLEALLTALAGRVAVFHHAPLDQAFLQRLLTAVYGQCLDEPAVDTLALERRRRERRGLPSPDGSLRLGAIREGLGLPPARAHDALSDAIATGEVLLALTAGRTLTLADLL